MANVFKGNKDKLPRMFINIGATLDIPTGVPAFGRKGETIINGGLHYTTGLVGKPNSFKSTIGHFMSISAANRIFASGVKTSIHTHDTELTLGLTRLEQLSKKAEFFPPEMFDKDDGLWDITGKDQYTGDEWAYLLEQFTDAKIENTKDYIPFNIIGNTDKNIKIPPPNFVEIDSLAEFEPGVTMNMLANNKKDEGQTNTLYMKQGLYKSKFLSILPRMSLRSSTYFIMMSHMGEELSIGTTPYSPGPTKKLNFLQVGQKIKGISDKGLYLFGNLWYIKSNKTFKNDKTKLPEYPKDSDDSMGEELALVTLTQLRGKNGMSGYTLGLICSQNEGVLPSLTEFHFIKSHDYYGLGGNKQNYYLELLPDVKLRRTNIRKKLDADPKIRRALNITSEMLQCEQYYAYFLDKELFCTPKELYEDIKKIGYDWDILLDTRGWYTIDQYENKIPFLSTIDLLRMRKGLYHPYWLKEDKITRIK